MRGVGWRLISARWGVKGVWSPDGATCYGTIRHTSRDGGQWLAFGPGGAPLGVGWRMDKREAAELVFRSWELDG